MRNTLIDNSSEQIRDTLLLEEGKEVEYKSAKGGFPQSFWETFSAFANSNGGIIVLGVKEKNGTYLPDGLTEEQTTDFRKLFWDDAHNKTRVSVPLLVESDVQAFKTEGGQHLLVFSVPRAPYNLRPVFLTLNPFGHTFKRRHEGDYVCTDDEVRQMFSDANNLRSSADSRILHGYKMDDIDMTTLRQYRRLYESKHEGHPWNNDTDMQFLEHVGAYRKDRATSTEGFTVAGMLMFGKTDAITDPECCPYFFLDYRERLSSDPSVRWTNRIYPDGTWETNLYQFYSRVLPLLQHALPVPFRLDENQVRIDTTSAHTALREALVNCIVHCAYTVMGNITIDRYPDRIVMSNPGTMLISMEEYAQGGHSVCRNPILQKMFVFLGIGERGGSGADTIAKGWLDNGWTPAPTLRECVQPDRVEATMLVPHVEESGIVAKDNPKNDPKNDPKDDPKQISDRQRFIIDLIYHDSTITREEMTQKTKISDATIKRDLADLQRKGILSREGGRKEGRWVISPTYPQLLRDARQIVEFYDTNT